MDIGLRRLATERTPAGERTSICRPAAVLRGPGEIAEDES
jgi:hypothetical protein